MTKRVIALGTFDGVHLGHMQILNRMLQIAGDRGLEPLIYTFSNHPLAAFGKAPKLIMQDEERLNLLRMVAPVEAVPFDMEYAAISPEDFAKQLVEKYSAAVAVAGFNYSFGAKGAGNMELLRELGKKYGFEAVEIPPFVQGGIPVSSSRIRACIENGDIESANALMGREFELAGRLEKQESSIQLSEDQLCPPNGKYSAADKKGREFILEINEGKMLILGGEKAKISGVLRLALKRRII